MADQQLATLKKRPNQKSRGHARVSRCGGGTGEPGPNGSPWTGGEQGNNRKRGRGVPTEKKKFVNQRGGEV